MKILNLILMTLLSSCSVISIDQNQSEQMIWPMEKWKYISDFKEVGWSEKGLEQAREYTTKINTAAVVIVSKGRILKEWGEVSRKFRTHSIRKSLLNTVIGIEVDNGHIDLKKSLNEIGIDDNFPLSEKEKTATIDNLLMARSCVFHPTFRQNLPYRNSCNPGNR